MQHATDPTASLRRAPSGKTPPMRNAEPSPASAHPNHPMRTGSLVTPAVRRVLEWHEQHSRAR